jgi:hypothetical protein
MWRLSRAEVPAPRSASHSGGCSAPVVGPKREASTGRSRRATSLATATAPKASPETRVRASAIVVPVMSRRRRMAVPPCSLRAIPKPLNRLVANSATSQG